MLAKRTVVIATMHAKESVIAPLLEQSLDVNCVIPEDFNTDVFGTFSGEIERKDDPFTTARKKCLLAMDQTGCDLAIASEGSFGAHPVMFFAQADDEIVLFVDRKNNFEVFGRELSTDTNYDGIEARTLQEALDFTTKVKFPSHGLILRDKQGGDSEVHKGIADPNRLEELVISMLAKYGSIWIDTDMRAMYNPTRMKVIEQATQNLITKLKSLCPSCEHPGYWISNAIKGLPCSMCGLPTQSTLAHEYSCTACDYHEQKKYPNDKRAENPMYCDFCNP